MKRSKHSLSHFRSLSCDMAQLVPIGCTEVLPGDTIQHATSLLVRTTPLNTPVMHPVHVRVHHWFVPLRLIWSNFQSFITGGSDGNDSTVAPYISIPTGGFNVGTLADHLGVPPSVGANVQISALPFRAYNLIFNEWYRDQDLVSPLTTSLADGDDSTSNQTLQYCAWEKDYFTSSRPWTQKGPAVSLPLGTAAPVLGIGKRTNQFLDGSNSVNESSGNPHTYTSSSGVTALDNDHLFFVENGGSGRGTAAVGYPNIFADLSNASAATINQLRHALAIQRYEEARARYGSRYTEYLRYLGVRSSDARLQRPEYLGGGKQTIQFSEVLQSAPTTSGTAGVGVGSLLGHGIGAVRSNRYRRFFEEHGLVISLLSVLPKSMYANGLPRMWSKTSKEDYWQKELEHIGQQSVYNKEANLGQSNPNDVFGYQDRYDEYRRKESSVHGLLRTTYNTWHLARIFSGDIALNSTFINANPSSRIFQAHSSNDELIIMAMHSIQARRLVTKLGTSSIF